MHCACLDPSTAVALGVGSWKLGVDLLPEKLRPAGVVFEADEVHQLGGGLQIFVERDGERMRVGLRIGGRQVNGKRVKVEFYSR
jgi:hypothetical protein